VQGTRHAYFVLVLLVLVLLVVLAAGVSANPAQVRDRSSAYPGEIRAVRVAEGLTRPWSLAVLPNGGFLITERPGRLVRLSPGGQKSDVSGLPSIASAGQGGLLDVVLAPDFQQSRHVFVSYVTQRSNGLGTAVARARLEDSQLESVEEIFVMEGAAYSTRHFGSRIVFLQDGTLLFTIGDRGARDNAQDLGHHAGSTLRIAQDGSVPGANPFVDRSGALPEIYSYGHRNAQGMAIHPETGAVWLHEHGPQGGDEVNIVEAGNNYGWPVITYGEEYGSGRRIGEGTSKPGMEQPVVYWDPSIAPSGMAFYQGAAIPGWQGDLFVGALAGRHLRRLDVEGRRIVDQEVLFPNSLGRIRDVRMARDGHLYLLTDAPNGALYRIEPGE
jgi:glucose/arabinose dehydrogenase